MSRSLRALAFRWPVRNASIVFGLWHVIQSDSFMGYAPTALSFRRVTPIVTRTPRPGNATPRKKINAPSRLRAIYHLGTKDHQSQWFR